MTARGRVILVGAGPGDPGLLTLRGAEALREADVVVHDALVSGEVLALARPAAERVNVGKRGHETPVLAQTEISALLVRLAREGRTVVRLKGGDPFVFGRGGEEASACAAAGVDFEVVPGVSAALAAAAYAGIPVTDRRHAASFATVTGHREPAASATQVRWRELALGADTLVILMGLRTLEAVVAELVAHGRAPETPAAVISEATTPRQRVVVATLADLASRVRAAGLPAPATIVVGDVVRLRDELAWFERRPLFGRRVLVTRAEEQAEELVLALRRAGAEPLAVPMLQVVAAADLRPLDAALEKLDRYDGLLFTSANAVRALADRAALRGVELAAPSGEASRAVYCVGPATAAAASAAGLAPTELGAGRFDAEGLLEAILARVPVRGRRFLLPRSEAARDLLPAGLRAAGAEVDAVGVYRPEPAAVDAARLREELVSGRIDALTFTSPSTVRHFVGHLDGPARAAAGRTAVVAIGPVTAAALREAGLPPCAVAERAGAAALVEALVAALGAQEDGA